MEYSEVDVNGDTIAVYQKGVGDTTIVFIHGNSLNADTFENQFDSELFDDFHLVAFDLPGHGNSGKASSPADTYNLLGYAAILRGLIAELKLTNYFLVGHSIGGHIAIVASADLDNQLKGLAIFGSPPISMPIQMENAYLPNPSMALAFQAKLTTEEAETFAEGCVNGEPPTKMIQSILDTDPDARALVGESVGQGKYKDEVGVVRNLKIPIAIMHGTHDALINLDYIRTLEIPQLWKGAVQVIINSGHSPQLEQSEAFNDLLWEIVAQ